jgi:hypothetical protein
MRQEHPRTTFGLRSRTRSRSIVAVVIGSVAFCAAVIGYVLGVPAVPAVMLGVAGLAAMAIGVYVHQLWKSPYSLKVSADGVDLEYRGRQISLPWSDIDRWQVGNTSATSPKYGRDAIMAWPASSVREPMVEPRRILWRRDLSCWQICEPDLTDGSTVEIVAAFRRFAPEKHLQP